MRGILRRIALDRTGAAALEFAIISVPLVVLSVGIVDFGRTLYARNGLSHAADVGARAIMIDGAASDAAIETDIRDAFLAGSSGALSVTLGTASDSGISFRTIELTYDIDLLTPLIVNRDITLSHSRRVPVED